MSIDANEIPEAIPQLDLERRQDDVLAQLDDLNERIENLIELYTRLRAADNEQTSSPDLTAASSAADLPGEHAEADSSEGLPKESQRAA